MSSGKTRTACCAVVAGLLVGSFAWADSTAGKKSDAGVAAYIDGSPISLEELDAIAIGKNMKLAQTLYDARAAALDDVILNRALSKVASEQGMSVDDLIEKRVAEATVAVTDADISAYFNSNKGRMGKRTLEQVGPQIKAYLARTRGQQAKTKLIKQIKEKQTIRIVLDPPRMDLKVVANDAAKGPLDAQVAVIAYSDFQ